jgi:hypothetical protein
MTYIVLYITSHPSDVTHDISDQWRNVKSGINVY